MPVKQHQAAGIPAGLLQPIFYLLGPCPQQTTQTLSLHIQCLQSMNACINLSMAEFILQPSIYS